MKCCDMMGMCDCYTVPDEVYILTVKTWESHEGGMHQNIDVYVHRSLRGLGDAIADLNLDHNDSFEVTVKALGE